MNSVLAFHEVPDGRWFDNLVEWLKRRYRLLPASYVSELYAGSEASNACHITVDDGHRSFYDVVFPVLTRHHVPATLFVSPTICAAETNYWFQELRGCDEYAVRIAAADVLKVPVTALTSFSITSICKSMPLHGIESVLQRSRTAGHKSAAQNVTVKELNHLAESGLVDIGAHTLHHPILRNESDSQSEEEVVRSVSDLASLLGREIKYFAYPNGLPSLDFTEREEAFLASAGVELAFSTESRCVRASDSRYGVPRIQISHGEHVGRIQAKLQFANVWNALKKLRPNGEYAERRRLSHTFARLSRVSYVA